MGPGGFALCAVLGCFVRPWAAARLPAGVPGAVWPALKGRAAVCAGGRRPAHEIATREPAARSVRSRGPPWPRHRPPAPRPGPAFCSSPVPSGPSGALRTGGPGALMVGLARRLEAPLQLLIINFARNSFMAHSNIEFASLELQRFWGVSKNDRDKLRAKCGWRWCRRRPRAPQPGPVDQAARLSETAVACARECLRGRETAIAFAGTGRASTETGIAFAGENWVFLARFSVALVLSVSRGVVQGRAVVMVVSCWPVSVVVEVSLVSPSPPQCVLCAKKFALLGLLVGTAAESSPCVGKTRQIGPFWASRASFVPHMR